MKYRIGIDMRMAGEGFGIGRYIVELVSALLERKSEFEYVLFFERHFSEQMYRRFSAVHPQCRLVSARYYSLQEQIKLPALLMSEKLDLVHFPNFNAPVMYPGKFLITIHDLIHHRFPGKKKKNAVFRLGYRSAIRLAAMRSQRIIAVSDASKRDIMLWLGQPEGKISIIYEGVGNEFRVHIPADAIQKVKQKFGIKQDYYLSVGEWRRYKNLPFLARAFSQFRKLSGALLQLVLAGPIDQHYPEIADEIMCADPYAIAPGKVTQDELMALYQGARALFSPSLLEGFGLPNLEAQAAGTPVAVSDIPVSREILGNSAIYFSPTDIDSCVDAMKQLAGDENLRSRIIESGKRNALRYTWLAAAEQTEAAYRSALKIPRVNPEGALPV